MGSKKYNDYLTQCGLDYLGEPEPPTMETDMDRQIKKLSTTHDRVLQTTNHMFAVEGEVYVMSVSDNGLTQLQDSQGVGIAPWDDKTNIFDALMELI